MMSLRFHFYFLILYAGIIIPTKCFGKICLPKDHVPLFIFGDSLVDVGTNNYIDTLTDNQANIPPYGETFFKYPTGRASNGRLIPDFLAEYANLELIPPYLHPGYHRYVDGANFASVGAGTLDETRQGLVVALSTQLKYFKNLNTLFKQRLGEKETKKLLSKAVYLTCVGSNDYLFRFTSNSSVYSPKEYVNLVIGNLTTVIKEIYKKGGRKHVFLNLGPLGCVPSVKAIKPENANPCVEEVTSITKLHNRALPKALKKLKSELKGFKYSIADFYTFLGERIDNPSKYGFKEGKISCCGTGPYNGIYSCGGKRAVGPKYELCRNISDYVFFDAAHPSEKVYQQFTEQIWGGTPNVIRPSLKELFDH